MASNAKLFNRSTGLDWFSDRDLQVLIDRFVDGLRTAGERGATGILHRAPAAGTQLVEIQLDGSDSTSTPDFRVNVSPDTLRRLVSGAISPLDAFREGSVRIANPLRPEVARRLFAQ